MHRKPWFLQRYIMIKLLSLFSGIGAFESALDRIGADYELVGFSEIDKFAIKSYCAVHGGGKNLGDITNIKTEDLPHDIDLITYGFPCQDISLAGKQKGFEHNGERTRSGLFFEALRVVEDTKPKVAICENVKNLTGKKFKEQFKVVLDSLEDAGYTNYWKVLNAKHYGVPQNRERVFIVSIRKDLDKGFEFPEPFDLNKRLKDILETDVDKKYYLSEKALNGILNSTFRTARNRIQKKDYCDTLCARYYKDPKCVEVIANGCDIRPKDRNYRKNGKTREEQLECRNDEVSNTLLTVHHHNMVCLQVKENTRKGYKEAFEGDSINVSFPTSTTRRGRVGNQVAQTLLTNNEQVVVVKGNSLSEPNVLTPKRSEYEKKIRKDYEAGNISESRHNMTYLAPRTDGVSNTITTVQKDNYLQISDLRIRKLTPKECWRLMGFYDEEFEKAEAVNSNTQLYKQAGNSIVVDVLVYLFEQIFKCVDLGGSCY